MEITTREELRALYGEPGERARHKVLSALDVHCRNFIARCPFVVVSTAAADGTADVSPKGDAPGFVAVADERTLVIPDRPGNNRLDGMLNVLENPHVGLLFLIPGVNEALRVNGRARISRDPALLEPLAVRGKVPRTALVVTVREAFLHCPKALIRACLWDPAAQLERSALPTMGQMLADQIGGFDPAEADRQREQAIRDHLY